MIRDSKKVQEQRRYLTMTIEEAFALYHLDHPDDKVHLTSFKSLRPDLVLLKQNMPHNVCTRQYLENINCILYTQVR